MRSVGIDIGTYSVKVVEIESTKRGLFLQNFSEHVYTATNPFDKDLEVIDFLRNLLTQDDKANCRFICNVSQDMVSVHSKIFPFKERLKISRSLPFELEEDTPFNPDDTIYDGRIVRTTTTQAEVLACACPKESVKKCLQVLNDSGIPPQLVTPDGFAIGNHFGSWSEPPPVVPTLADLTSESEELPPPGLAQAVLQIGHSKTILVVFSDSGLIDIQTLSWGGDNIAKAIEAKYKITYSEALKQVRSNGFILTTTEGATTDQILFSNLIAETVQDLIKDLRLTLIEIQSRARVNLTQILLTGGVSRLQNLGPYLTQGLELPVNRFNLLDKYPNVLFDKNPQTDVSIATSLGLAIEGLRKPRNPAITLLRMELAVQSNASKQFLDLWGATLKFAAFATLILYIYANLRESTALTMAEKADEVMREQAQAMAQLKGGKASEQGLERFIQAKRKAIKEIKDVEGFVQMKSGLEILKSVNDAVPGRSTLRMEVKSFSLRDTTVRVEGFVSNEHETEMLKKSLLQMAKDQKINTVPTQFVLPAGKVAFGFQFEVDRNIPTAKTRHPASRSLKE